MVRLTIEWFIGRENNRCLRWNTDYKYRSKYTHFRWKTKWRLEILGALRIIDPFKVSGGMGGRFYNYYYLVLTHLNSHSNWGMHIFNHTTGPGSFCFNTRVVRRIVQVDLHGTCCHGNRWTGHGCRVSVGRGGWGSEGVFWRLATQKKPERDETLEMLHTLRLWAVSYSYPVQTRHKQVYNKHVLTLSLEHEKEIAIPFTWPTADRWRNTLGEFQCPHLVETCLSEGYSLRCWKEKSINNVNRIHVFTAVSLS